MVQCLIKVFFVLSLIPHVRFWASYEAQFLCFFPGPIAQILLTTLKTNYWTNQGISYGYETSADEYSTRRIRFCFVRFCLDIIWKVILKKEVKNDFYKNEQSRFGISLPRAFQQWSRNCRRPSGLLVNWFFVCFCWRSNSSVEIIFAYNIYVNCANTGTNTLFPYCNWPNKNSSKLQKHAEAFAKFSVSGP